MTGDWNAFLRKCDICVQCTFRSLAALPFLNKRQAKRLQDYSQTPQSLKQSHKSDCHWPFCAWTTTTWGWLVIGFIFGPLVEKWGESTLVNQSTKQTSPLPPLLIRQQIKCSLDLLKDLFTCCRKSSDQLYTYREGQ